MINRVYRSALLAEEKLLKTETVFMQCKYRNTSRMQIEVLCELLQRKFVDEMKAIAFLEETVEKDDKRIKHFTMQNICSSSFQKINYVYQGILKGGTILSYKDGVKILDKKIDEDTEFGFDDDSWKAPLKNMRWDEYHQYICRYLEDERDTV